MDFLVVVVVVFVPSLSLSSPTRMKIGGFTLSDLLDKSWSQVSTLLLPGICLHFYRA